jgi:hypothetical protein
LEGGKIVINIKKLEIVYENHCPKEQIQNISINELNIDYIKTIKYGFINNRAIIVFGYDVEIITYDNNYDYLKSYLYDFEEITDRYNNKFLINKNHMAYISEENFGKTYWFINQNAVNIEL